MTTSVVTKLCCKSQRCSPEALQNCINFAVLPFYRDYFIEIVLAHLYVHKNIMIVGLDIKLHFY